MHKNCQHWGATGRITAEGWVGVVGAQMAILASFRLAILIIDYKKMSVIQRGGSQGEPRVNLTAALHF